MQRARSFRDTIGLGGWLFADLMLALAMLFFAANTKGEPPSVPRISGFAPVSGPPGITVVLRGENFFGVRAVKFADRDASFTMVSASQVEAIVPRDAMSGPLSVVTAEGLATSPGSFTVLTEPTPTATAMP